MAARGPPGNDADLLSVVLREVPAKPGHQLASWGCRLGAVRVLTVRTAPARVGREQQRQEQGLRWLWLEALQGHPDHVRPWRTWSYGSAPPVWVSRRRCMGSLEASRYSVELKTNTGSGSRLTPGEDADHDHGHGHFYCLALFRLGSRRGEAESHLGGASRNEGEVRPYPSWGRTADYGSRNTPQLLPPRPY